ncbi:hypothetical protein [Halosimplex pelagicum]|uniref:Ig-like domain-containing protein n=1 Tax=Halosimplex pelagicum TaxID=869886 RepID=A0A7D5P8Z1_9EURY|nr:hypothetical protein [Halosimplex pelagicum]QLH80238.1 hypothetical protein HZS54_00740 [Halosimplex pelagicum]
MKTFRYLAVIALLVAGGGCAELLLPDRGNFEVENQNDTEHALEITAVDRDDNEIVSRSVSVTGGSVVETEYWLSGGAYNITVELAQNRTAHHSYVVNCRSSTMYVIVQEDRDVLLSQSACS